MLREDVVGRLIAELGRALAGIKQRLLEQKVDEAEREIAEAEQMLGLPRGIEQFDARSAALVAGGGDKVVLAAMLLELRAGAAMERGAAGDAQRHRARALALLDCASPIELVKEAEALRARLAG